ncbi:YidB family protein [Streptomyces sp. NPDC047981]|uniref:YidB family protein n=1 Tax=Streptomyces sp. NPDC047981 TaxID=3154610 RepID=UPI0034187FFC
MSERDHTSIAREQVASWMGDGPNEPLTAGQVTGALGGEDALAELAEAAGKSPQRLAAAFADQLPRLIDAATAEGTPKPKPKPESANADDGLVVIGEVDGVEVQMRYAGLYYYSRGADQPHEATVFALRSSDGASRSVILESSPAPSGTGE